MERLRNDASLDDTTAVVVTTRSEAVARGAHAVLRLGPDGRPGAPPPWQPEPWAAAAPGPAEYAEDYPAEYAEEQGERPNNDAGAEGAWGGETEGAEEGAAPMATATAPPPGAA